MYDYDYNNDTYTQLYKFAIKSLLFKKYGPKKEASANAKTKAEKRHKLLNILSRKQDASDEAKTEAEILAELEALDA